MSENFKKPSNEQKVEKTKNSFHQKAKELLLEIQEKIEQKGGSHQLIEHWDDLQEKIDSGKVSEALGFLEKISFKRQENIDSWREAIFQLSRKISLEISPLAESEIADFIQEEFAYYQIIYLEQLKEASTARKIEIIENEIRTLYQDYVSLKNSVVKLEQKKQLTENEAAQLKEDKLLVEQMPGELYLYRRVRDSLYRIDKIQKNQA